MARDKTTRREFITRAAGAAAALGAAGAAAPSLWAQAPPTPATLFTLTAGDTTARDIVIEANTLAPRRAQAAVVVDEESRKERTAQIVGTGSQRRLLWVEPEMAAREVRACRVRYSFEPAGGSEGVKVSPPQGDAVEVTVDGKLFTRYVFRGAPKPYLYPVIGPTGQPINRHYPMKMVEGEDQDHPHQRSLWFTHGDVNGVDYWAEGDGKGRVVHRRFRELESGPVLGRIVAESDWVDPQGRKVLSDLREVRVIKTPDGPLLDFAITLTAAEGAVTFGDTKEGTFGFRVASSMDVTRGKGGRIVTSKGLRDTEAWGTRAEWVDYSGPVEGERVGLAILDHPTSFRHPTYWHVRDYGLFAANPFGIHDFKKGEPAKAGNHTLEKGESLAFRYRLYPHRGDETQARVAEVYSGYTELPTVRPGGPEPQP